LYKGTPEWFNTRNIPRYLALDKNKNSGSCTPTRVLVLKKISVLGTSTDKETILVAALLPRWWAFLLRERKGRRRRRRAIRGSGRESFKTFAVNEEAVQEGGREVVVLMRRSLDTCMSSEEEDTCMSL
jgi:hypothetical protein